MTAIAGCRKKSLIVVTDVALAIDVACVIADVIPVVVTNTNTVNVAFNPLYLGLTFEPKE